MEKFLFYQDTKVITWERDHFTVEAENYEEAVSFNHMLLGLQRRDRHYR